MTSLRRVLSTLGLTALAFAQEPARTVSARFHHVHLNSTDPRAAIDFYTAKFDCEQASFAGLMPAVWAQKSWLLFTRAAAPPPHEITSAIWHIGWGAEDMPAAYRKQLESGTKFATPLTDISALVGQPANSGKFFYAYVDGPDHALIELNTAPHHRFGHLHLLSLDPITAAGWYEKHLGFRSSKNPRERLYEGFPVSPSASMNVDNVNIIIFPVGYARKQWPEVWKDRTDFETTRGRAIDHIGFSVDNLEETLARLRAEGVRITAEPRSLAQGRVKFAFIEGPDHIAIELIEGHATKQ